MQRGIARGVKGGKAHVIPGRSPTGRRGRGSSARMMSRKRRCPVFHREPLRGDIVLLDPLPLRRCAAPAGDDRGRYAAARIAWPVLSTISPIWSALTISGGGGAGGWPAVRVIPPP